ncbi:MAG: hypothetical protein HRU70_05485 [Phycisphaeraceae bacterium]|nr:MAG: hypothetical protein HRU70_05485 [Phycisphaeraceae bacterium]
MRISIVASLTALLHAVLPCLTSTGQGEVRYTVIYTDRAPHTPIGGMNSGQPFTINTASLPTGSIDYIWVRNTSTNPGITIGPITVTSSGGEFPQGLRVLVASQNAGNPPGFPFTVNQVLTPGARSLAGFLVDESVSNHE